MDGKNKNSEAARDIEVSKHAVSIVGELRELIAAINARLILLEWNESEERLCALDAIDAAERALRLAEHLVVITANRA